MIFRFFRPEKTGLVARPAVMQQPALGKVGGKHTVRTHHVYRVGMRTALFIADCEDSSSKQLAV